MFVRRPSPACDAYLMARDLHACKLHANNPGPTTPEAKIRLRGGGKPLPKTNASV